MSSFLPQRSWRSTSGGPEWTLVASATERTELLQSSGLMYAAAVSKHLLLISHTPPFSVVSLPQRSTEIPALATCIISNGGKSSALVSYHSFLHQLMMSQSIHKFVVICLFENFDTATGCRGMKELSGWRLKWSGREEGDISRGERSKPVLP